LLLHFDPRRGRGIAAGFWVGTVTKVSTLYSIAMLKHWDKMQKHMPGSGLSAFVRILEETGQELGRVSDGTNI
jgi:hypothetical protein